MGYSFNMNEAELYFEMYLNEWLDSHQYKIEENTYYSYQIIVNKTAEFFERKKH